MIFRRFGYLRTRVLLNQQDVLRQIETALDDVDAADSKNDDGRHRLCCREEDENQPDPKRKRLLGRASEALKTYGKISVAIGAHVSRECR
jgi:hypothetical protein